MASKGADPTSHGKNQLTFLLLLLISIVPTERRPIKEDAEMKWKRRDVKKDKHDEEERKKERKM